MSSKRILVAEDEDDVAHLVRRVLSDAGYEVELAGAGGEAMEKVAATRPDLLVLDLMMPGIDGWEVLRRLKQMKDPPLVLILSARCDSETFERGTREGAAAFVSKPFQFHELVATCQKLLSPKC